METASRHHTSSSPSHHGLLRSIAKLVRLHRRVGSSGNSADLGIANNNHNTDDSDCRSFFSFKPSRLKQSGPLHADGSSVYAHSEAVREEDVKRRNRGRDTSDTVLAMVFAGVSAIKAAYAQLQLAQAPYDPEAVQAADVAVVAELKRISQIKHWYLSTGTGTKQQLDGGNVYGHHQLQLQMLSPDAHVAAEILELRSLVKTYQVTTKKLENELKCKDDEAARLARELKQAEAQKRDLEQKLRAAARSSNAADTKIDHYYHPQRRNHNNHHRSMSSSFTHPDDQTTRTVVADLATLTPALFLDTLRRAVKSARSFTRELVREMQSAGWDVCAAAAAIAPDTTVADDQTHLDLVLLSYICRRMFSAFQYPQFKPAREKSKTCDIRRRRERFLEDYVEMEQQQQQATAAPVAFEEFLRDKYRSVVHPRMEAAFFGRGQGADVDHDQQQSRLSFPPVSSCTRLQNSAHHTFFRCFHEMARRVWMLQRLFHAFEPEAAAAVFEATKGTRFSEVYMNSVLDVPPSTLLHMLVGFTVVPGFKLRGTVIPCRVYLFAEDGTAGCRT